MPTRLPRHFFTLPAMKTFSTLLGFIRFTTTPGALLSGVTSILLCQQERGTDALRLVFVGEDSEQDAVHGCLVLEGSHRSGPSADFAETSFDGICGPNLAASV